MKLRRKPHVPIVLSCALLLTVIAACSGGEDGMAPVTATPSPTESASPTATPEPTATPMPFVAPLTGLPSEREVTNRPLSVMINNLAPARPQSGMTQADVVWELLAEGGITRFVTIFQSNEFADPIGPVRSTRPYFIQVGEFYSGVIVHAGASNDGYAVLQRQKKQHLDGVKADGVYYYRDNSRKAPHNLYTTLDKLREGVGKKKYPETALVPKLTFSDAPNLAGGLPATEVGITFMGSDYKVSYTYDSVRQTYARFINGDPHVDKNNGEQLAAANVVVLAAKHDIQDSVGRLAVDLDSGGEAVLIHRGVAIPCSWERKDGDVIRLTKDGKELPFVPGITYYHVVPTSSDFASHVTYQ